MAKPQPDTFAQQPKRAPPKAEELLPEEYKIPTREGFTFGPAGIGLAEARQLDQAVTSKKFNRIKEKVVNRPDEGVASLIFDENFKPEPVSRPQVPDVE